MMEDLEFDFNFDCPQYYFNLNETTTHQLPQEEEEEENLLWFSTPHPKHEPEVIKLSSCETSNKNKVTIPLVYFKKN